MLIAVSVCIAKNTSRCCTIGWTYVWIQPRGHSLKDGTGDRTIRPSVCRSDCQFTSSITGLVIKENNYF